MWGIGQPTFSAPTSPIISLAIAKILGNRTAARWPERKRSAAGVPVPRRGQVRSRFRVDLQIVAARKVAASLNCAAGPSMAPPQAAASRAARRARKGEVLSRTAAAAEGRARPARKQAGLFPAPIAAAP